MLGTPNGGGFRYFRFGEYTFYPGGRGLYRDGVWVSLRRKSCELLEQLLQNAPRAVPREELLTVVWGGLRDANVIEQSIHELRATFGDARGEPTYIQTVHGVGYRFIAPLEIQEEPKPAAAPAPLDPLVNSNPAAAPGRQPTPRRRLLLLLILVLILAAVLIPFLRRKGPPGHAALHMVVLGRSLQAVNGSGEVLWTYVLPRETSSMVPEQAARRTHFMDVDGDGSPDHVIFVAPWADRAAGPLGDQLFCFNLDGRLAWDYRPDPVLQFAKQSFDGPWRITDILIQNRNIWLAVTHEIWWPAFLVRLTGGQPQVVFVNSGTISDIALLPTPGMSRILIAGVNNEYESAMLAALPEDSSPAVSPQSPNSPFHCRNCAGAGPAFYALFPRTEFSSIDKSSPPYGVGRALQITGSNIELEVEENRDASSFYRFTTALAPVNFAVSDGYLKEHALLQKAGRISHTAAECKEVIQPRTLRLFTPQGGWRMAAIAPQ